MKYSTRWVRFVLLLVALLCISYVGAESAQAQEVTLPVDNTGACWTNPTENDDGSPLTDLNRIRMLFTWISGPQEYQFFYDHTGDIGIPPNSDADGRQCIPWEPDGMLARFQEEESRAGQPLYGEWELTLLAVTDRWKVSGGTPDRQNPTLRVYYSDPDAPAPNPPSDLMQIQVVVTVTLGDQ